MQMWGPIMALEHPSSGSLINFLISWGFSLFVENEKNNTYFIKLLHNLNGINYSMCLKLNKCHLLLYISSRTGNH